MNLFRKDGNQYIKFAEGYSLDAILDRMEDWEFPTLQVGNDYLFFDEEENLIEIATDKSCLANDTLYGVIYNWVKV